MTNALLNALMMAGFLAFALLAFALLAFALLAFVLFLVWRRAVGRGPVGPLSANLGYASCVAVIPPAVWCAERACLMSFRDASQSFWAHMDDIAHGFALLAALWTSWGVGALVACLAA
ncbi:hypothetical protein QTI51_31830 [Variovorax sp. J22G73]|uniref:hypothetical protein n=1 Tax=unclassified Variovorax TaxID=663243 RepID=UPI00257609AC|nr:MULTISPECIES: hypothetical protein [unclassified Variovorax]MDM0009400.1 hypothetical protein [Variovorax sp. J22R203]MDM0101907.1 hypothetical protein [Variovorax sp. J22G73]